MAILSIITEPNEILRTRSKPVTEFSPRLHEILCDMADTMHHNDGVGIAAVQVGVLWRACLVNTAEGPCELVNPEIVAQGTPKSGSEGCLSIPGAHGNVSRPQEVTVRAQDRHGTVFERIFTGREAVCVCHELDHLDGVLFIDRMGGRQ